MQFFGPDLPTMGSYFQSKADKIDITIEFCHHRIPHIQISLGIKVQLKLTISIFLTRFTLKVFFWSKTENVNTTYFLYNSALSSAKFQLKLTILIFWIKFAQNCISSRKQKSEYHHGILHIWISLGTKFQLKLIILSFWTKFTPKKVFPVENRTSSPRTTSLCFLCGKR